MADEKNDWEVIGPELKKLAADYGNQADLAEKAGLSVSTLQKMLAGNNEPSFGKVTRLARVLGVGLDDLARGRPGVAELLERSLNGGSAVSGWLPSSKRQTREQALAESGLVTVAFRQEIEASAGPGTVPNEDGPSTAIAFRQEWLQKRHANADQLQAIRVRGDSMEPTLRTGDLIVIDTERKNPTDGLFVVRLGDDLLVKRLQRLSPTRLVIASDNPLAGTSEIDLRDESQHPVVIGQVIWLGRDL